MGSGMSEEERRESVRRDVERVVKKFKKCPDVKVNRAIVMFSSTSSSDKLQQHLNDRKERDYPSTDWMKTLAETLASLSPDPKLAGLGALAVAVFIDTISATSSTDNMKEALRCVFAEEKASEVWDQIDECLKRCMMHINDDGELTNDLKWIECQLSAAITKLKNSMVRDGHMSSQALKAWVNGAAFHIQMLIHLVRLRGIQTCDPVERLLSAYLSDLELVFKEHKAAVRRKCKLGSDLGPEIPCPYFENEEGEAYYVSSNAKYDVFEGYYKEHYSSQECEIRNYLTKVRDDLPSAVSQVGHLSVSRD